MRTPLMIAPLKRCVAALGLVAVAATAVSAQEARTGSRWLGWVGCWTASVPGASAFASPAENSTFVCITPSAQAREAVDVTTISEGKVVSTQRIDASGAESPLDAKGCAGVQRAAWSSDERRIYLRAASTCDGLKSATSGILSMTSTGEWLDVRGVSSYGSEDVRVARYRDAGIPASVPTEIASVLRERGAGADVARMSVGARIGVNAVIEASRAADSAVVAAWLLEREQRFDLDAKTLVQLADAGVPGTVTDALVAVSNPSVFHVARASAPRDSLPLERVTSGRRVSAMAVPYDPWMWGTYGLGSYRYGYPYGYGYGYGLGYGAGGYGYNNGYYGGYAPPIIIVNGNDRGTGATGQMVKGRGYTQPGTSSSGTARERPSRSSEPSPTPSTSSGSSSSGSSSSGSSSSGSSSSGSSSSGSSEGRTAKPRS